MTSNRSENAPTGRIDQLLAAKLKTAEGRRTAASFAATYCCDVATESHDLNSSVHRLMLQRIAEILFAVANAAPKKKS